jgi:hypothetical protein
VKGEYGKDQDHNQQTDRLPFHALASFDSWDGSTI